MTFSFLLAVALITSDGPLMSSGWNCTRQCETDEIVVEQGVMRLKLAPAPTHRGIGFERKLPVYERGEFSFEVKLSGQCTSKNDLNLWITLGNTSLATRRSGLQRYVQLTADANRNWKSVALDRFRTDEFVRVRVVWDNARRRVKYYVGDMRIPALVEENAEIKPLSEDKMIVSIHNYGHMDISEQYIRNMEYGELSVSTVNTNERNLALVFRGPTADRYPLDSWTKGFSEDQVLYFDVQFTGAALFPRNQFMISGMPDDDLLASAQRILVIDCPLYYEVISEKVQRGIIDAVRDGAQLLVAGGPFGLEKCGNFDSPIAQALPVKLVSPWEPVAGKQIQRKTLGNGHITTVTSPSSPRH